jgi:cytochrome c oxidase subunit 3
MEPAGQDLAHAVEAHPAHLQHHFTSARQQFESGQLGMWLFLATEVLLFSGLFCAYAVYRANHPEVFIYAHQFLDRTLGGLNTVVLICSSMTMACAVHCAQCSRRRAMIALLAATLVLAACFLGVKGIEYEQKWKHGLLWGKLYHPTLTHEENRPLKSGARAPGAPQPAVAAPKPVSPAAAEDRSLIAPAAIGPRGLANPPQYGEEFIGPKHQLRNVQVFFGVYFLMTGLHALHVIAGMAVIAWLLVGAVKGRFNAEYFTPVDLGGLYWHLVDIIWIFLFPLLYLIR